MTPQHPYFESERGVCELCDRPPGHHPDRVGVSRVLNPRMWRIAVFVDRSRFPDMTEEDATRFVSALCGQLAIDTVIGSSLELDTTWLGQSLVVQAANEADQWARVRQLLEDERHETEQRLVRIHAAQLAVARVDERLNVTHELYSLEIHKRRVLTLRRWRWVNALRRWWRS